LTTASDNGYPADVDPVVDLAPGADHDPLARQFADRVQAALERVEQRQAFQKMRGSVGVVADDADTALTLRFDFGRLTIHEGLVGVPTVTIRGQLRDIEALTQLSVAGEGWARLGQAGRAAASVAGALRGSRLKIYGLVAHPRLVLRLLRVLAQR